MLSSSTSAIVERNKGEKDKGEKTNEDLQRAVDAAAQSGGGRVEIPAGIYTMHDALRLRSGVHVVGESGAILRKAPSVSSALSGVLGYGFYEFCVEEPEKFCVGMGVHITDDDASGFYTTAATITHRSGDTFFINRPFNHDYSPAKNGKVTSLFSLIEGANVENVVIENLVLDGNAPENESLTGCRGAGVFLLGARSVRIEKLEVHNFFGDAISFQQCADIAVRGCDLHHNRGGGLHPGSGSVRYLMAENHCHDNEGFGIFYCLRTTHSHCIGNIVEANGESGISIGERDSDHLLRGNIIRHNARQGIVFRHAHFNGGDRVIIQDNDIADNCARLEGESASEILIESGLRDVHIIGNRIESKNHAALRVEENCKRISFAENIICGRAQREDDVIGAGLEYSRPAILPPVGPQVLPLDGARHLNIAKLSDAPGVLQA